MSAGIPDETTEFLTRNKKNLAMQGVEPWTFALLARRSNQLS